jgi:hypothetical protein
MATSAVAVLTVPLELAEALEYAGTWTTGGTIPWMAQTNVTHDGLDAAKVTLDGGQTSWLETTVEGPGSLSFWWKIYSYKRDSSLRFYVDGVERLVWVNDSGWQPATFALGAGSHVLRWVYGASGGFAGYMATAWLDEVRFVPTLVFDSIVLTNGSVQLRLLGEPGQAFTLQGTEDFFHWADLGRYTNQTGTLVLTNVPPAGHHAYFYRTVFRPAINQPAVPRPSLSDARLMPDGRMRFQLNSTAGSEWRVEGSPDLFHWGNYGVVTNQSGTLPITNTPVRKPKVYFYRVARP